MRCTMLRTAAILAVWATSASVHAQIAVPGYSSRPGAAYTLYLDFGGFSFTGIWGGSIFNGGTPGVTPAYSVDGNTTAFSTTELANIRQIWAWQAEKYAPFNVNVTTVDPAPNGSTDPQRQAFYDSTAQLQHQVIGGTGAWTSGIGVSYIDVIQNSYATAGENGGAGTGRHTNWVFSNNAPSQLQLIAESGAHENGHAFGLQHQSDRNAVGSMLTEYSGGNWQTNGSPGGNGTVAPTMGASYYAQRGTWRYGSPSDSGSIFQNDGVVIQSNTNMGNFYEDNISHNINAPSALPMTGNAINFNLAKGVIVPTDTLNPDPIGANNYTSDFFSFSTTGGLVTINLVAGSEFITPGVADNGAMIDGSLFLYSASNLVTPLFSAATITLGETISQNLLAGNYVIQVASAGGKLLGSLDNPTSVQTEYFDMGSFFLTGTIPTAVPEPTTIALCGLVLAGLGYSQWSKRRKLQKSLDESIIR